MVFFIYLQNLLHCTQPHLWRNALLNWLMSISICYVKPQSRCRPFWNTSRKHFPNIFSFSKISHKLISLIFTIFIKTCKCIIEGQSPVYGVYDVDSCFFPFSVLHGDVDFLFHQIRLSVPNPFKNQNPLILV